MALTAPAQRTFPTVDQGTYAARVTEVKVEDHMNVADNFGNKGFYTLVFRWELDDATEDLEVVSIPLYVKFQTGDKPLSKGPRAGRLPMLTEITRAFGEEDLQPGDEVDEQAWVGKRANLGILEQVTPDGGRRNSINSVKPIGRKAATGGATRKAPAPVVEDDGDVPF